MWFASIWVFTLRLPWTLGADFFLRHLLDGDPASNTLSWRWVAGHQTQGKNYLARPDNIARFTNGRFNPAGQLATDVDLPAYTEKPPVGPSPTPVPWQCSTNTGLLITEEDLTPEEIFGSQDWPMVIAVQTTSWRSNERVGDAAMRFAHNGLIDSLSRNPGAITHGPMRLDTQEATAQLCQRLREAGIQHLLTPWIPTGPTADALAHAREQLTGAGITLQAVPRRWDVDLWPAATHGFFRFWKAAQNYLATV